MYGVSTVPIGSKDSGLHHPSDSTDPHKKTDSPTTSKFASDNQTDQPLLESSTESSSLQPLKCVIDESVFDVGKGYHLIGKLKCCFSLFLSYCLYSDLLTILNCIH